MPLYSCHFEIEISFIIYLQKYHLILPIFLHKNTKYHIIILAFSDSVSPSYMFYPSSHYFCNGTISNAPAVVYLTFLSKTEAMNPCLTVSTSFPQDLTDIDYFVFLHIFRPTDPPNF